MSEIGSGWWINEGGVSYLGVNENIKTLISNLDMVAYYNFGVQGGWMLYISS